MKLPLTIHYDLYGAVAVFDANHRVVCRMKMQNGDLKFAQGLVHKFNRDWRYRLFGRQPYEYTREDWLEERNTHAKA